MSISPNEIHHKYKPSSAVNAFEECEFDSFLNHRIVVLPQASLPVLELFGESFGPFFPSQPIEIPIWIAQEFDRHGWIRIHELPSWMLSLPDIIQEEKSKEALQPIPFDYITVGKWITSHLKKHDSSGTESSKFQLLLRDLEEIRSAKLFGSNSKYLKQFLGFTEGIGFGTIDQIELCNKRSMILDSLEILNQFDASF